MLRLITDPGLATVTGRFFDGRSESRAHRLAYQPAFRDRLRAETERVLGPDPSAPGATA